MINFLRLLHKPLHLKDISWFGDTVLLKQYLFHEKSNPIGIKENKTEDVLSTTRALSSVVQRNKRGYCFVHCHKIFVHRRVGIQGNET
jgi:hypothetical protein